MDPLDSLSRKLATTLTVSGERKESKAKLPPLPPKHSTMNAFHKYKDQLMKLSTAQLPAELKVNDVSHYEIFRSVLLNHPRAMEKIGVGLDGFFIRRSKATDGKDVCCCYVRRTDGTEEDFSLFKCYGTRSWKDDGNRFDAASGSLIKRDKDEV